MITAGSSPDRGRPPAVPALPRYSRVVESTGIGGGGQAIAGGIGELLDLHDRGLLVVGRAVTTREARRRTLHAWARWLGRDVLAATSDDVLTWLAEPRWSAQTRQTYLGHIRGFYTWATATGLLAEDPTACVGPIRVPQPLPKPFTDRQVEQALAQLPQPAHAWFTLAAYAGLRCCEIAGLRGEDVDHEAGTLFIRSGKGSAQAMLPAHPLVMAELAEMPRRGPLWRTADGQPVTARQVSTRGFHALAHIGVGGSMHRGRHSFGTSIYRSTGGDIRVTQELLRHRSPATTARYTLITVDDKRTALAGLPTFG